MTALILGLVLALGALYYVLHPILNPRAPQPLAPGGNPLAEEPPEPGMQDAIDALREVEFDRATGKLSESDYTALKSRYTEAALSAMRAEDANAVVDGIAVSADDDIEKLISRFRYKATPCADCGPRPEPDARFCSSCGRFLGGSCQKCGAPATEPGARFCSSCGAALAA